MPAAAVIPAPIAYIKVAAVKKLVVGLYLFVPAAHLRSVVHRVVALLPGVYHYGSGCPILG